jgi:hypothetical protein
MWRVMLVWMDKQNTSQVVNLESNTQIFDLNASFANLKNEQNQPTPRRPIQGGMIVCLELHTFRSILPSSDDSSEESGAHA